MESEVAAIGREVDIVQHTDGQPMIFEGVDDHPYCQNVCFLCGRLLSGSTRTEEHVFPRWLQERFDLKHRQLWLHNQTSIAYRQLRTPCCRSCNNESFAQIENKVRIATAEGYEAVASLEPIVLFYWLAKLFFGVHYKALHLPANRADPDGKKLITAQVMATFRWILCWLQTARKKLEGTHTPGSIFVFPIQKPELLTHQFDLWYVPWRQCVGMRMGSVGIVADLIDCGIFNKLLDAELRKYQSAELHPFQFDELTVMLFYQFELLWIEKWIRMTDWDGARGVEYGYRPAQRNGELLLPFNAAEYGRRLEKWLRIPFDIAFEAPDGNWTCLDTSEGKQRTMPLVDYPIEIWHRRIPDYAERAHELRAAKAKRGNGSRE